MANHGQVSVAIGVIRHGSSILLTKRMPNVDCPNLWEFPGGKVRECETLCVGLARELSEEINIKMVKCRPFIQFGGAKNEVGAPK